MLNPKLKHAIYKTTKTVNLLVMIFAVATMCILQDLIVKRLPRETSTRTLQSWMTFFTLAFLYIGITEVYDETCLMLFRPKQHANDHQRSSQGNSSPQNRRAQQAQRMQRYNSNRGEQSCIYDFVLCGGIRRCIFASSRSHQYQQHD